MLVGPLDGALQPIIPHPSCAHPHALETHGTQYEACGAPLTAEQSRDLGTIGALAHAHVRAVSKGKAPERACETLTVASPRPFAVRRFCDPDFPCDNASVWGRTVRPPRDALVGQAVEWRRTSAAPAPAEVPRLFPPADDADAPLDAVRAGVGVRDGWLVDALGLLATTPRLARRPFVHDALARHGLVVVRVYPLDDWRAARRAASAAVEADGGKGEFVALDDSLPHDSGVDEHVRAAHGAHAGAAVQRLGGLDAPQWVVRAPAGAAVQRLGGLDAP
ncbi:hypothetical protein KFE25_000689 [Diacronema lutheri]|uniref:Uncharacterized protein n=1 Tax=Diacronema lutheri TaxID=2081491 RepID=A0A8J5XHG9_DIALT|nr:hypothetical protein KFE25_000689 [Diacronema lutheri]